MAFKICQTLRPDYLLVEVLGTYEAAGAVDLFPLVLSTCRLNAADKVLIDYRRMDGDLTDGGKAVYALAILQQYQGHLADGGKPLRVAYLGQPHQVSPDEPGAVIAKQRDLPFRVTTDLGEALSWLGVQEV